MLAATAGTSTGGINPREYFNTVLFTGNAPTGQSITGVGFAPDLTWFKSRTIVSSYNLVDKVRGAFRLRSDKTDAESSATVTLDSDGFTVGAQSESNDGSMVAWNWKAGVSNVTNEEGTITSTVRANTTSGFSIVTYAGSSASTVGHGLGVAPAMIIAKQTNNVEHWVIYHQATGKDAVLLFTTNAVISSANYWGSGGVTSTVFGTGGVGAGNAANNIVAYCFAEVEGFSKFGSYTGNGSATGPSVTTDFEPTWLMIKRTDTTGDWIILDSARDATNPRTEFLEPNTEDEEDTGNDVDFNATGFQLKSTSASTNATGGTYIYACFA
jgi:hypothetical protein